MVEGHWDDYISLLAEGGAVVLDATESHLRFEFEGRKYVTTEFGCEREDDDEELVDTDIDILADKAADGTDVTWSRFLTGHGYCSENPLTGNRPCDNGTLCDKCQTDDAQDEYILWKANIMKACR